MSLQQAVRTISLSRRTLMVGAGVSAVAFTAAQSSFLRARAAQSESLQDILDITATVEQFGVTFLGAGLEAARNNEFDMPWPAQVIEIVTAARAQEAAHLAAFEAAGGRPMVDTFTISPNLLTVFNDFFTAVVDQETAETAAQVAAMRAFTEMGRPDFVKVSFQYGAEEAEHRVLANYTRGNRPANDRAFAEAPYTTVGEILDSMRTRGVIDGPGTKVAYPGPGEIDDSNITETEPGGVAVACGSSATPGAGTPSAAGTPPVAGTPEV